MMEIALPTIDRLQNSEIQFLYYNTIDSGNPVSEEGIPQCSFAHLKIRIGSTWTANKLGRLEQDDRVNFGMQLENDLIKLLEDIQDLGFLLKLEQTLLDNLPLYTNSGSEVKFACKQMVKVEERDEAYERNPYSDIGEQCGREIITQCIPYYKGNIQYFLNEQIKEVYSHFLRGSHFQRHKKDLNFNKIKRFQYSKGWIKDGRSKEQPHIKLWNFLVDKEFVSEDQRERFSYVFQTNAETGDKSSPKKLHWRETPTSLVVFLKFLPAFYIGKGRGNRYKVGAHLIICENQTGDELHKQLNIVKNTSTPSKANQALIDFLENQDRVYTIPSKAKKNSS